MFFGSILLQAACPYMSKYPSTLVALVLSIILISASARAQVGISDPNPPLIPAPAAAATVNDPFTVTDVMVDRTAKNAVIAREEAIAEAQRLAFRKLAERNLDEQGMRTFVMPDDATIAATVQDFEIKSEQLSFTRYAANFTVRFRDGVRNYIPVKIPDAVIAQGQGVGLVEAPASKFVLVLPYFEDMSGRMLLWEDPNPWRRVWQGGLARMNTGDRQFFVPLGDISDISAGSSEAVWSGDYTVVEKLRAAYKADEVILAVANKSGVQMTVETYSWKDGRFENRGTLKPFIGDLISEEDAYKIAALEVLKSIDKKTFVARPIEAAAAIAREVVGETAGAPAQAGAGWAPPETATQPATALPEAGAVAAAVAPSLPLGPGTEIDASMSFTNFSSWMEMQKRLSKTVPPVKVDIRSINKSGASFTMKFQGSVDILKKTLADHGIALSQPAVSVDPTVIGGEAQRPVYDLQLVN